MSNVPPPPPPPPSIPPPPGPGPAGWGQEPGAPPPYGQPAYGQPPYGQPPYGQPAYGYGMPVAPPSGYANFGQRLVAQLLDGLLAFVAYIPAIVLFIVSFTSGHDGLCTNAANELYVCRQPNGGLFALAFLALALGLLAFIFYMSRRLGRTGQTPGKKVMGIKVVDKVSGQPIGAGRAFGRYVFAQFISGSFCALGYLWMLWDGEKQTWHDKVVSSIVVRA